MDGWEEDEGPIPLWLRSPMTFGRSVDPGAHYLKSVIELKWALAERALISILVAKQPRLTAEQRKRKGFVSALEEVVKKARKWGGKEAAEAAKKISRFKGRPRDERNALAHGKLTVEGIRNTLQVGPGKQNMTGIEPVLQGAVTMALEEKSAKVVLDQESLRAMNKEVDELLAGIGKLYEALGLEKVRIRTTMRIENESHPNLSFAPDQVVKQTMVEKEVNLSELYKMPETRNYECQECGAIGVWEFAARCHGKEPVEVQTEHCPVCCKVYNTVKVCEHLAIARRYEGGDEAPWHMGSWTLTASEARAMAAKLIEGAERKEKGEEVRMKVDLTARRRSREGSKEERGET